MKLLDILNEQQRKPIDNREKLEKIAPKLKQYLKKLDNQVHIKSESHGDKFNFTLTIKDIQVLPNRFLDDILKIPALNSLKPYTHLLTLKCLVDGYCVNGGRAEYLSASHFPAVCELEFRNKFLFLFSIDFDESEIRFT